MPSQLHNQHPATSYLVISETGVIYMAYLLTSSTPTLLIVRLGVSPGLVPFEIVHCASFAENIRTEQQWATLVTETVDIVDQRVEEEPTPLEEAPYTGPRLTRYQRIWNELRESSESVLESMGLSRQGCP